MDLDGQESRQAWLFQGNPDYMDFDEIARIGVGGRDSWSVSSNWDEMRPNDNLVIWRSGSEGGIVALGRLTSEAESHDYSKDPDVDPHAPFSKAKWRIWYEYTHIPDQLLARQIVKEHPILNDLGVFKRPRPTNHRVTAEQWSAILELMKGQSPIDVRSLVSAALSAAGLRFSGWQVATFCTALQTKGLVILTGISGTGKSKLAQHFADLLPWPVVAAEEVTQESDEEQRLRGLRITSSTKGPTVEVGEDAVTVDHSLFLSVRPDWRDSKSLLGYYNPLTGVYEWTPFLRHLMRAVESYRAKDGLAWFVILDEMNLAHVEYYFADLLSVLESGRDSEGWTREAVRLGYPDEAEGDLPPREVRVPPNLYVVGTVNMDETTFAFSPKVLDRAFTIELTEVDFGDYPVAPANGADGELSEGERRALLRAFTRDGRFARIEKGAIARYVEAHPELRGRLQRLNDGLRPFEFHFGYRVFDEIVAFCDAAAENGCFDDLGGEEAAFDSAVLMKVLPKFHGSQARLEGPLRAVLAWCVDPDAPSEVEVDFALKGADPDAVRESLEAIAYRCPRTAKRARQMLWTLQTEGFAAFG